MTSFPQPCGQDGYTDGTSAVTALSQLRLARNGLAPSQGLCDNHGVRILHVNLTSGQTHIETFARTYLGGNGLAIRLLYERLTPGIEPLAPDNMLVFAVGSATDTLIPGATRCFVGTKSPSLACFLIAPLAACSLLCRNVPGLKSSPLPGVRRNRCISWGTRAALTANR
jgi:hypothetical protein